MACHTSGGRSSDMPNGEEGGTTLRCICLYRLPLSRQRHMGFSRERRKEAMFPDPCSLQCNDNRVKPYNAHAHGFALCMIDDPILPAVVVLFSWKNPDLESLHSRPSPVCVFLVSCRLFPITQRRDAGDAFSDRLPRPYTMKTGSFGNPREAINPITHCR